METTDAEGWVPWASSILLRGEARALFWNFISNNLIGNRAYKAQ